MPVGNRSLRVCINGHRYYKITDCPTCPQCESERKPKGNFMQFLAAPARRALENQGIITLQQLSQYSETEILQLHGMGRSSIHKLRKALNENELEFNHPRK